MSRKLYINIQIALLALVVLAGAYMIWFSPTKIAFVNYQVTTLGQISKANDNTFIKLRELSTDELKRVKRYDMVFINAMGLRITEEERGIIQKAADKGVHILTTAATNPANSITSIDEGVAEELTSYLTYGGRRNYGNMLEYVRKYIDKKKFRARTPEEVVPRDYNMLYHIDPANPEDDELGFNSVREYNEFLQALGIWDEGKPAVVVTGVMGEPSELIASLERSGDLVYPVNNISTFVKNGHIDSVNVAAVVNMAHGRMGDYMVEWLKEKNVPLFAPLNVNSLVEEWEEDKMGMSGGFLSQSIVTPEIDGAVRPYALFGNYVGDDGLQHLRAIPERLESFVQTINNYVALKTKPNSEKKVAIYYYKGAGENALTAAGLEVGPSLYNLLKRMQKEGYDLEGLPSSAKELERMLQEQGAVFAAYAEGAFDRFMHTGSPALVSKEEYEEWTELAGIRPEKCEEVVASYGEFPGQYMVSDDGRLGVARLQFGNVVMLPQNAAGSGDNEFQIVHGTDAVPPYTYIASYLWTRYGFGADVLVHFGTHGSLEFTPRKQVALSDVDWPDRLVGTMPHIYVYTIANVGEAMTAKRRSYAGIQSHLTAPFMESGLRGEYRELSNAIQEYYRLLPDDYVSVPEAAEKAALKVKELAVAMGVHRDLGLDSLMTKPYTEEEIERIEEFAEEIGNSKITGQLYTMGVPYENGRIVSSVYAMTTEPLAYSLYALDRERGKADAGIEKHKAQFTRLYIDPAKEMVGRLLAEPSTGTDKLVCDVAGITSEELAFASEVDEVANSSMDIMSIMMNMASEMPAESSVHADKTSSDDKGTKVSGGMRSIMQRMAKNMSSEQALKMAKRMGASPEALKRMEEAMGAAQDSTAVNDSTDAGEPIVEEEVSEPQEMPEGMTAALDGSSGGMAGMMKAMTGIREYTQEEKAFAAAVMEIERAIKNVGNYRKALLESPEAELASFINALDGGYIAPSPGGDPIVNPNTLPTGRNLYAINAEETPSEAAWEKGKKLAANTIDMYRRAHNDSIPRKVSYTLWSGEFIETGGATIAQVLYMLGVEPIRDAFSRVTDLRLIPSEELGRPRIDVVVQTSGQLRDIAASRLFLISRAVTMAANANDDVYENYVAEGVVMSERTLIDKGLTPKDAREISFERVFGGVNGGYGTGIQGMVARGDRWEDDAEIANVYLNNMGAFYGSERGWETVRQYAFEAALVSTDVVIQPQQSNTWGALSLDHVYEFMGGMNLAVRNVTGKDPDAYMSDYRNRNHARIQDVKEALGVESRTSLFNPTYIREKMKGGASDADVFAELVENTYGWNVMKPKAIDNEMWDEIYNVYVQDKFSLGVQDYFEEKNPYALQEMTGVMMETARKGYWKASEQQLNDVAQLHTELVEKYGASGGTFTGENLKLQDFIAQNVSPEQADKYKERMREEREVAIDDSRKGMVMKKETTTMQEGRATTLNGGLIVAIVLVVFIALLLILRQRRKRNRE